LAAALARSPGLSETSATAKNAEPNPDLAPISAIHAHVCGIHFYSGNMKRQIIAQHYCAHVSDEGLACVLFDRGDRLPLGIPQLMMPFTNDGQLDPEIAAEREKLYPVSVAAKKAARADIPDAKIDPRADGWQKEPAVQFDLKTVSSTAK
jgi:Protein of unknown function (DUF1264)